MILQFFCNICSILFFGKIPPCSVFVSSLWIQLLLWVCEQELIWVTFQCILIVSIHFECTAYMSPTRLSTMLCRKWLIYIAVGSTYLWILFHFLKYQLSLDTAEFSELWIIRPPDIPVGGLMFYRGFFLLLLLSFFRRLISELAEWNSTKIGHTLGSYRHFKKHIQNLGYPLPLPLQIDGQEPPFLDSFAI